MEDEIVMITKKPGIKNCIRISDVKDIPDFLKDVVSVQGEELVLDCLEGKEKCPLGSVIAFEKLDNGKMNVWNKANWKETTKGTPSFDQYYVLDKNGNIIQSLEEYDNQFNQSKHSGKRM